MTEEELIVGLKAGVQRTANFMAQLTEYHGGPAETEYLITSDIAREFLNRGCRVAVEAKNRQFCSALMAVDASRARKLLGRKRTDVAIGDPLAPDALVEVKIRAGRIGAIKSDLNKLTSTLGELKQSRLHSILAASVFQIHRNTTKRRSSRLQFQSEIIRTESNLEKDLSTYAGQHSEFTFKLQGLHDAPFEGIADQTTILNDDGVEEIYEAAHATRYYAVIIKHRNFGKLENTSFSSLKRNNLGSEPSSPPEGLKFQMDIGSPAGTLVDGAD